MHRYPFSCVSIGLTIGKRPVVGVVFNPILGESTPTPALSPAVPSCSQQLKLPLPDAALFFESFQPQLTVS